MLLRLGIWLPDQIFSPMAGAFIFGAPVLVGMVTVYLAEQERRRTEADEAADKEAGNTGMAAPVGLAQRAWPLLNMMEESLREETPVVWGV